MATIRISDLSADSTPSASDLIPVDGATTRKTTLAQAVAAARPLANQAEAEAGTDAAKAMTPLTTKQAIVAIGGTNFATVAQGAKADTAVQPGDLSTVATSGDYDDLSNKPTLSTVATSGDYDDLSNKPTLGSAAAEDTSAFATANQGATADSAVQPGDLATVATSGDYDDLSNKPTLGSAAAENTSAFATAAQGAKADTAVQPAALAAVQVPTGGTTGQVLAKSSNTDNDVEWTSANAGDVLGPSSAADSELAAFDTTTGKLLKKSTVQLSEIARATPTPPTFAYRFKEGQPLPKALSFTRASTAVRRNRAGLPETVAANVLRHSYDSTGAYLGVRIEGEAENILTYSEQFDNAAWNALRSTVTANATTAPDGTATADKLTEDATSSSTHIAYRSQSYTSGTRYCISFYAKAAERTWVRPLLPAAAFPSNVSVFFDLANGTIGTVSSDADDYGMEDAGNGWWRCWMSSTANASTNGNTNIGIATVDTDHIYDGDGSSGLYIWGAQLEVDRASASTYIQTVASAVTRAEDELRADLSSIGFNEDEGTFYWSGTIDDAAGNHGLMLAYETSSAGISISYDGGNFRVRKRDGGSSDLAGISYTPAKGEIIRVVGYWTATLVGISVNGSAAVEVAGTEAPSPTEFRIGDGHAGAVSGHHNGTLLEWAVYDRALSAVEAAIMSARGPAIGETLYVPETVRRRYVAFSDFAPTDDTKECYPAWLAAKAEAERTGGQLVFDGPYGQTRHYRFLDRTLTGSQVVDVSNIVDIAFNGGIIDCSAFALSGARRTLFYAGGTLAGVQHSLSSSAAAGDTNVTLSSGGSSYAPGDLVFIRANNAFTPDYANKTQEKQIVKRVAGNVVHFTGALRAAYTTGNSAQIEKINPGRTKRIVNPQVIGPGRWTGDNDGDYGIWLELLQGAAVIGGKAQYADFNNFRVANCFDTEVINATSIHAYEGDGTNTKNQYAFNIQDGCEGVYYRDCHAYGGKHAMVQGVGGVAGVTRDCGWLGGSVQDTWHNAGAAHTNAERLRWEGIDISACAGGIDPRTEFATVKNNTMRNLSRSTAITVGALGIGVTLRERLTKWVVTGNEIDGCNYGMRLGTSETIETGPGFLDLNDNTIRNAAQRAIEVYYDDTDDSKFGLSICRNTIYGTAGVGIYTFGDFRYAVVSENTLTGGGGFACITMTGNTGQGPRSPVVENNRYQGHTAPSVTNSTGTSSVARNFEMT